MIIMKGNLGPGFRHIQVFEPGFLFHVGLRTGSLQNKSWLKKSEVPGKGKGIRNQSGKGSKCGESLQMESSPSHSHEDLVFSLITLDDKIKAK